MSTDNSLPTPPSASASAPPTPASTSATTAASSSQTADPAAAANSAAASTPAAGGQPADATATANGATGSGTAAAQQQSQQQPPPPTPAEILETVLQQIVSSNGGPALANALLNFLPNVEAREIVFASTTPEGADPLEALDMAQHTIGILFILSARLTSTTATAPAVPFAYVENFCRSFNPEEARHAPERVTTLAKGIVQGAETLGRIKATIQPLYDLLTRFTPDLSYLTPVHPIFVTACATARFFSAALPILAVPISQISTTLCPDLRYQDHLVYHYTGGVVLAALRRYAEAAEFFELCASAPVAGPTGGNGGGRGPSQGSMGMSLGGMGMGMGMGIGMGMGMGMGIGIGMGSSGPGSRYANLGTSEPSVFQVEAAKKLLLVQLILHGKALPLPKYTHQSVSNLKGTPYHSLARVYPNLEQVHSIATKERTAFVADDNLGLLKLVVERAPRWAIRKLTETYLTLSLTEIGRAAGIDEAEVRRIVLSMIETGEIDASIDAHGSVTFTDDEPTAVSKAEVDRALRVAQEQEQVLRRLEREIARNKDYLQKAVRSREEGQSSSSSNSNWPYIEEELWAGSPGGRWTDESVY